MSQRQWNALNRQIQECELCPRLREHCQRVAVEKRNAYADHTYWGRPVPNFGDRQAEMLIVGLAPGAHGANRTGRMFTGDRSGDWLYRALFKAGFANQEESTTIKDGMLLKGCAITAACHCAPPQNKPSAEELRNCLSWFRQTIDSMSVTVFLALGQIAWKYVVDEAVNRAWLENRKPRFGHGQRIRLAGDRWLLGCYHPSQQNTFTKRLTEPMLDTVFRQAKSLLRKNRR